MYTSINEWKKHLKKTGKYNEMFEGEPDFVPAPDNDDLQDSQDDFQEEREEGFTLDSFREAIEAEYAMRIESLEEGEEAPIAMTEEQIEIAFEVCQRLCSTPVIDEQEIEDDFQEEEEEVIEEGLGDFFRGGSKEEIEKKKQELTAQLDKLVADAESKNYKIKFKDLGAHDKPVDFNKEEALKLMAKNNFLGSFLKPVVKGDIVLIGYKPGAKGLNKLAAGTSSQTTGQ
jgi:hypothetical protein